MTSTDSNRLMAALERRSDLELRLSCGKSIRAHSLKLSLASSVLGDLIDAVMDEQITATRAVAKRMRDDEGTSDSPQTLPQIMVCYIGFRLSFAMVFCLMESLSESEIHVAVQCPCRWMESTRTGWRC